MLRRPHLQVVAGERQILPHLTGLQASLMRRFGARLEVARDNMGHAGGTGSMTLDAYSKTWWNERVEAVTRIVEAVFAEPDERKNKEIASSQAGRRHRRNCQRVGTLLGTSSCLAWPDSM